MPAPRILSVRMPAWLFLLLLWSGPLLAEPGSVRLFGIESQSVHLTTAVRKYPGARQAATTVRSAALWRSRSLSLHLSTTFGQLVHKTRDDTMIGIGPSVSYRHPTRIRTLVLEAGSGIAWIDGDGFARQALGQRLQFLSHLAAGIALAPHGAAQLLLRLQHISNAGLAEHNPGLDSAGLELRFRFGRP